METRLDIGSNTTRNLFIASSKMPSHFSFYLTAYEI
jgi:hypothetical protein